MCYALLNACQNECLHLLHRDAVDQRWNDQRFRTLEFRYVMTCLLEEKLIIIILCFLYFIGVHLGQLNNLKTKKIMMMVRHLKKRGANSISRGNTLRMTNFKLSYSVLSREMELAPLVFLKCVTVIMIFLVLRLVNCCQIFGKPFRYLIISLSCCEMIRESLILCTLWTSGNMIYNGNSEYKSKDQVALMMDDEHLLLKDFHSLSQDELLTPKAIELATMKAHLDLI